MKCPILFLHSLSIKYIIDIFITQWAPKNLSPEGSFHNQKKCACAVSSTQPEELGLFFMLRMALYHQGPSGHSSL